MPTSIGVGCRTGAAWRMMLISRCRLPTRAALGLPILLGLSFAPSPMRAVENVPEGFTRLDSPAAIVDTARSRGVRATIEEGASAVVDVVGKAPGLINLDLVREIVVDVRYASASGSGVLLLHPSDPNDKTDA